MRPNLSNGMITNSCSGIVRPAFSPNLNQYDAPVTDWRTGETWFTNVRPPHPKIAVIELSTKAVKLLVNKNPDNTCHNIFSFNDFYRETAKTETGMLLDFRNTMDESGFVERVLPTICQYAHTAQRQFQVDMIYAIATAAYRTASNQKRILRLIKAEAGLNVRILSKNEEANASLHAYIFSCSQREKLLASHHHILIDQGGGSTEISLFNNKELVNSCSLETGTTLLKTLLFRKLSEELETGINRISDIAVLKTQKELASFDDGSESLENAFCIGLGTAITHATGAPNNRTQHEKVLTIAKLVAKRETLLAELCQSFNTVADIKNTLTHENNYHKDKIDRMLVTCLGIPVIISIMEHFKIQQLTVSGTSLFYGAFYEQFFQLHSSNNSLHN